MNPQERRSFAAWLSVASNSALVLSKLSIGLWVGSVSVISEAAHSGVDLLASLIALVAIKAASKPADKQHPFGHGKAENISGTIEALLIFLAAAWIVWEASKKLLHPANMENVGWGFAVMLVSAVANWLISKYLLKVARETDSIALEADAWHLRTDVYTSAGVMAGLGLIWLGEKVLQPYFPGLHLHWLDPVVAIAVALLIFRAAWELTSKSAADLMDRNLPPEEEDWIHNVSKTLTPAIRGIHSLRTRKSGPDRFVEFHMVVDAAMSVDESHRLSHEIADKIEKALEKCSVTVHVEPCARQCDVAECSQQCNE